MDTRLGIDLIVLTVAATVWIAAEGCLILKDRARNKGKTGIDNRSRAYNTISLLTGIGSAAIISGIPVFRFTNSRTSILLWIGIATMCIGFFLRHWAIRVLGRSFRTTVELDEGQRLIQNGPYKWIRHPSYSGIILFCIGYGLVAQNWLSLILVVLLPTIALVYRINIEEKALLNGIGEEYEAYQKKTKKLLPGVW
jgi:protein-S-isoprenylcysteine O-methyltransferase Ste14